MEELVFKFYMDGDVKGENFKAGPGFSLNDPMLMAPSSKEVLSQWRNVSALKQVNFLVETYEASSNKENQVVKQTGDRILLQSFDLLSSGHSLGRSSYLA
ncbi:MAG: hypothetical protein ACLT63_14830 [Bacteroides xylanisolvens]